MIDKLLLKTFLVFFLLFLTIPCITADEQSLDEFIFQIQKYLENKNIPAYLSAFSPEIRDAEKNSLEKIFNVLRMNKFTLHRVTKGSQNKGQVSAYFRVLYRNEYSAIIETWELFFSRKDTGWQIERKDVVGNLGQLYKLKIPSDRVERVKSIAINHVDIKLSFEDAVLFYDNIPEKETALIIIGKGHLFFSPSDPKEQHQLQLLYKKKALEDRLEYAYLRFSNSFFQRNIKIEKASFENSRPLSQKELDRANSIFNQHYPRSFTSENSLTRELLSFLPRGNQAVFEFKGKKTNTLTYIYSPFSREEVNLVDSEEEKFINLYSPPAEEGKKKLYISFDQKFDIKSYQIDIDFNPKQSFLSGKASIEVESKVNYLDSLKLKFSPELQILRIFDEEKNELFYTQDKLRKLLYVYLFRRPRDMKSCKIEVYYRGKLMPPKQIADTISPAQLDLDKKVVVPYRYQSHLFSQSAFWYPSPPNTDYFKARLKIIIPPDYACISNGELKEYGKLEKVAGVEGIEKMDNSVYVYETNHPVKYLSFIVGKFSKVAEDLETFPVEIFASPNYHFQKGEFLDQVKSILEFYQSRFGPFPFEKLSIVHRHWPYSGGHSPASFIVLNHIPLRSTRRYINSGSPVDLSRWKEYFIAHEIAHQWWGQAVTWASYHDQWLSEGLAQFSAVLYLKEIRGSGIFSNILKKFSQWTEKKSVWGAITMGSRLSYFDFKAYQSIIYNKTSLVLNMLLEILGKELFFEGLKEFYSNHKYSAAGTRDFIKTMERVTGEDLKIFFKGWFDSYLLPEVKVTHSIQKDGGGYLLKFKLFQLKELFVFPLQIEWKEKDQKIVKKFIVRERKEDFEFRAKERPEKIRINPDKAVPGKFS